jgi:hypothetical protein
MCAPKDKDKDIYIYNLQYKTIFTILTPIIRSIASEGLQDGRQADRIAACEQYKNRA